MIPKRLQKLINELENNFYLAEGALDHIKFHIGRGQNRKKDRPIDVYDNRLLHSDFKCVMKIVEKIITSYYKPEERKE